MKRLVLVAAVLAAGCQPAVRRVVAISVEPPVTTLELNGQSVLRATLKDDHGAQVIDPAVKVAWLSSAPAVSVVDDTGKVTGAGPGSATITAAVPGGPSAQVTINVNPAPLAAPAPVAVAQARPAARAGARPAARPAAQSPLSAAAKAASGFRINTKPGEAQFKFVN